MSKAEATVELKAWPFHGYAPGSYFCLCHRCEQQFEGDKRAIACLECAVIMAKAAPPVPQVPEGEDALARSMLADQFGNTKLADAIREGEDGVVTIRYALAAIRAALARAGQDYGRGVREILSKFREGLYSAVRCQEQDCIVNGASHPGLLEPMREILRARLTEFDAILALTDKASTPGTAASGGAE